MNVLIIDANETDRQTTDRLIRAAHSSDLQTQSARSVTEAQSHLDTTSFDLVFIDLVTTGDEGLELIEQLSQERGHTAIITLNGDDNEEKILTAMRLGAQDHLAKRSLSEPVLRRAIRYALERKQAESEMRKLNQQLEEALNELREVQAETIRRERLSAIGSMVAGIAHDFNQALSPIVANTDYLLEYPETLDQPEQCMILLRTTKEAAQKASDIVRRLKSFYKPTDQAGRRQDVDLNQVIEDVIQLANPHWEAEAQAAGKQIRLRFDATSQCHIPGSSSELSDAFLNLLMNAIDAIHESGDIDIRLEANDTATMVTVSDTGCGMDEATQRRCFEPFVSTKGLKGTGLGLAATYGIIKRHHGTISVKSSLNAGTRFRIEFPKSVPAANPNNRAATPQERTAIRVLLVDDEPAICQIAKMFLQKVGHQCVTAAHAEEALEILATDAIDLVITDRAMPGMSGDELAARINALNPDLYIVMLTGYGDLMAAAEECPAHIAEVIPKPFTSETLKNIIENYRNRTAHS